MPSDSLGNDTILVYSLGGVRLHSTEKVELLEHVARLTYVSLLPYDRVVSDFTFRWPIHYFVLVTGYRHVFFARENGADFRTFVPDLRSQEEKTERRGNRGD